MVRCVFVDRAFDDTYVHDYPIFGRCFWWGGMRGVRPEFGPDAVVFVHTRRRTPGATHVGIGWYSAKLKSGSWA